MTPGSECHLCHRPTDAAQAHCPRCAPLVKLVHDFPDLIAAALSRTGEFVAIRTVPRNGLAHE